MKLSMLDVGCGAGGATNGFVKENFECTGIDIEDYGYPGLRFIQADIRKLDPLDFQGFDVIWVSMPCRDWCLFAKRFGKTWKKNPPNPKKAFELVKDAVAFVKAAKPKFWIMENTLELAQWFGPARVTTALRGERQMVRSFWGNFPDFLIPHDNKNVVMRFRPECNIKDQVLTKSSERAKIPLCVSQEFAKIIKEKLLVPAKEVIVKP
jgi:site-specific DNA-cytosine methylase